MSTPSLLNIPYLYKAGTLYSQIPESGAGDFTVTRATTPTAGLSTRVNKNGLIELVADNVPRLDYPLGGAVNGCPALLTEPSAQNLLQRSEEFENAYWTKSLGVVTQNQTIGPDGLTSADKYVVDNGASSNSPITRSFTFLANTTYTLSLFVKKADYDTASIRLSTTETGVIGSFFNLASGTATNNQIQNYGNGWYRVWVTFTTAATVTSGQIQLIRDAQVRDGVAGIFIWGAQLEVGSVPTSYIPTTTQAITRAADIVRRTGITSLIGQSEGTVYFEVEVTAEARDKWIFSLDSAANSFIQCWVTPSREISVQIQNAGSVVMTTLVSSALSVGYHKLAFAYNIATNGCQMFVDGVQNPVASRTVTGVGLPAFNNFSYGGYLSSGSAALKAHVRAGALYPNRLSNAQLATLTAP